MSVLETAVCTRLQLIHKHKIPITKTRKFLLHVLELHKYRYDVPEFIECYLKDVDSEPKLVLCFQNKSFQEGEEDETGYKMLIHLLNLHPLILDDECKTDDDDKELILTFKFPKEYLKDLQKFLNGDYSQLSTKFKEEMAKRQFYKKDAIFTEGTTSAGLPMVTIHEVLNPTETKIKAYQHRLKASLPKPEILSIPNLELELYKPINQFKIQYGNSD